VTVADDQDPDDDALPDGWQITLDLTARRTDHGRTIVGGTPFRVLQLTDSGARWLDRVVAGEPLPSSRASRQLARRLVDGGLAIPHPTMPGRFRRSDVSLVVPARDDPDGLRRTIETAGDFGEVIVVDDGSRDQKAVRRGASGATIVRNEVARGPGAARNQGWRSAKLPLVAFVDADVELGDNWSGVLVAHFDDPTVGAVAPRVRSRPGRAPRWLAEYESVRSPLDLGPLGGPVRPGARVTYVPTAVLLVRRDALDAVDGFDERLHVGEDVDLVWRLHEAGWRVRYEPAAQAHHPARPGVRAWIRQRVRYGTSAAPLASRHHHAVAPLGVSGWSALAWSAVLFGRPRLGAMVGVGTTLALTRKLRSTEQPLVEAARIAGLGNLWAGRLVADTLRRTWWPIAVVLWVSVPRTRPALLAAAVVPSVLEWRERQPALGTLRFGLLRLLDDLAYGAGVWIGCARERSGRALLPRFTGPLPPPRPIETTSGPISSARR
jgi:mycofactocin system glycosyltransferase